MTALENHGVISEIILYTGNGCQSKAYTQDEITASVGSKPLNVKYRCYMRKNPYYILRKIGDEFYLVPYGQAIENKGHTVHVSEVAAFLWDEMDVHRDIKALAGRLAEEYEVMSEDADSLEDDVRALLKHLEMEDMVFKEDKAPTCAEQDSYCAEGGKRALNNNEEIGLAERDEERLPFRAIIVAGVTIRFFGIEKYFSEHFLPFCVDIKDCDTAKADDGKDICIYVTEENPPKTGHLPIVLRGMSVVLFDVGDYYVMRSIEMPEMREGHFWKDGSKAVLYMDPDARLPEFVKRFRFEQMAESGQKKEWNTLEEVQADFAESVFHAVRHAFLLRAQCLDMYVIHSASILYNGQAWLFSALSGTGKSTHTNIWHKLYGTPFIDGDLNLLAFEDGKPVVKGIPWCGTSGIFTTETYPLGGIILLARDKKNHVEELSFQNQVLGIQMRFISPKWNAKQTSESLEFAERIAKSARIARLYCNMEDEAAEVCRAWIDAGN